MPVVAADGEVRLYVPDVCVEGGTSRFVALLNLAGGPDRPASLRTTLMFDPSLLTLDETEKEPAVQPGHGLLGHNAYFSHEEDPEAGEISIVLNSAGMRPVLPLPAGELAEMHFRLKETPAPLPTVRLDLDPGRTVSFASDGRATFVAAGLPAFVWFGQTEARVRVDAAGPGEATRIETTAMPPSRPGWILRGRSTELVRRHRHVAFKELTPLGRADSGQAVLDEATPDPGESFYYLIAQSDGTQQPVLGFDSGCHSRRVRTEITRKE